MSTKNPANDNVTGESERGAHPIPSSTETPVNEVPPSMEKVAEDPQLSLQKKAQSPSTSLALPHSETETIASNTNQPDNTEITSNKPTDTMKNSSEDSSDIPPEEQQLGVLGRGMKEMVNIITKLRASGIENLGMPLPRIAVVGNQSAGKSSLIEAISGIKVPRSSGTCTRCPLEINLLRSDTPAETWRCRLSLRIEKDYVPSSVPNHPQYLNPWAPSKRVQTHAFLEIHDKAHVENALERAQEAILNPSTHWREYQDILKKETSVPPPGFEDGVRREMERIRKNDLEVKFSPNVVCMEITGPNLPNLAFIDLPGVIQTTESEQEKYLIGLVTDLVKDYISQADCLILLALTMKDDANNQSAAGLARDFGEDRTIGALTKPDTVEHGDHGQWVKILRNEAHRIRHGYFVTKQPNQAELNRSIDNMEARRLEKAFFETVSPWKDELLDLQHRFGTEALAEYLADQLGDLIRLRLPTIQDTIEAQTADVEHELSLLPAPPTENQTVTVNNLVKDLDTAIADSLVPNNRNGNTEFDALLFSLALDFRNTIKTELQPSLRLYGNAEDEERAAESLSTPSSSREASRKLWPRQQKTRETTPTPRGNKQGNMEIHEILTDSDQESGRHGASVTNKNKKRSRPDSGFGGEQTLQTPKRSKAGERIVRFSKPKFSLPYIRAMIEKTTTPRVPGNIAPEASTKLILESLEPWKHHITRFNSQARKKLDACIDQCLSHVLRSYRKTPLYNRIKKTLEDLVVQKLSDFDEVITKLWQWESRTPKTLLDKEIYCAIREGHLAELREERRLNLRQQQGVSNEGEQQQVQQRQLQTPTSNRGRRRNAQTNIGEEVMVDPYEQELQVLAGVRAYHEIAANRFADILYSAFVEECVMMTRASVLEELRRCVGLGTVDAEEECKRLLVEDPQKEIRRKELLQKKAQLAHALDELTRW